MSFQYAIKTKTINKPLNSFLLLCITLLNLNMSSLEILDLHFYFTKFTIEKVDLYAEGALQVFKNFPATELSGGFVLKFKFI